MGERKRNKTVTLFVCKVRSIELACFYLAHASQYKISQVYNDAKLFSPWLKTTRPGGVPEEGGLSRRAS